mmetsp:Transcript_29822/g.81837  ORF Transcript_29822/g.81837 Transcript_29822/m.81837 type:complete len:108 (+) Transcript_29822:398-721(+)
MDDVDLAKLASLAVRAVVLFGVETHVCVQQSALDLLELGYEVHVLADGVSSQRAVDRDTAIERMRQAGVFVTTTESVLFELTRSKDHAKFKIVSALAKQHASELRVL